MVYSITWDDVGTRLFDYGVDRVVIYPNGSDGIPWNGVISITEDFSGRDKTIVYYDGKKITELFSTPEFSGSVKSITYPEAFSDIDGTFALGNGLYITGQEQKRFGMCYRTSLGNDVDGEDHGYKIHILYNLLAIPSSRNNITKRSSIQPVEYEWKLNGLPEDIPGFWPSSHIIFNTTQMSETLLSDLEGILYGNGETQPRLPSAALLSGFIDNWAIIRIIDNEDGTFTIEASDQDNIIQEIDTTTFDIFRANVTVIDGDSYYIRDLTY